MLTNNDIEKTFRNTAYEKIVRCDFAVVLGCSPEQAKKRAVMAAHFYHRGGTQKLIVSGGVCHEVKGEKIPEYRIMHDTLRQNGVPEDAIIDETRATDTIENMVGSLLEICQHSEVFKVRDVTVISELYHLPRSLLLCEMFFPPYFRVFGYTEEAEAQYAAQRELMEKEIGLLNWVMGAK